MKIRLLCGALAAASLLTSTVSGCAWLIGFPEYEAGPPDTFETSGTGGTGGPVEAACTPGKLAPCYDGPGGTEGVGICHPGTHECKLEGVGYNECLNEATPKVEDCATSEDENCDGKAGCTGEHAWSKRFGNTISQGVSIAVDGAGNVLVTGYFQGTLDFGQGLLTSAGGYDLFVAKFDAAGNALWSKRFGDTTSQSGTSIAVDGAGNVLVTGYFQGILDFGQGPLTSEGSSVDLFVAKFDAAGNALWSKRFGDTTSQSGTSIAVDGAGNVLVTGYFQGILDFGQGPLTSAGGYDLFVAKFDAAGNALWSKCFGDTSDQYGSSIAVDGAGNVLMTGRFGGTVDFGQGPLTSAGGDDLFVAKFDAAGNALWSKRFGDTISQSDSSIAVDGAGNVLVTGSFPGILDFGQGPLTSEGSSVDLFVAKFDAAGNALWSKRFGDANTQVGNSIAVDGAGNVLVTGYFGGTVDFGQGLLTSAGGDDLFVAKFDAAGNALWSKRFGDTSYQYGISIAVDGAGNVLVTGSFGGTIDLGGGPLTSAGKSDIILAKFAP